MKQAMGIYCYSDKTFYYLEAGDNYISNTVDRIKKTLIQRDLIKIAYGNFTSPGYDIISRQDAEGKDYSMKPIFLSKFIKETFEGEEKASTFK